MASAPTIRAVGTIASGTTTIAPGLPSGTTAGDLLLMFLENDGSEAAPTASGWTQLLTIATGSDTTDTRLTVLYKTAAGSDATTTNDPGDHICGRIIGITAGTWAVTDTFNASQTSNEDTADTSGSIPGVTTTLDNCLILAACTNGDDPAANGTANYGSWTNANLSSLTERIDNTRTSGNGGGIGVASGILATAGATGATTVTLGVASFKAMATIAIAPLHATGSGAITVQKAAVAGTGPGPVTETLYASQCSALESYNATYATAVAGSNLSVVGGGIIIIGQETSPQPTIWASYIEFDLTSLGAGTVTNPVLSLYLSSGPWNAAHTMNVREHDFGTSITTADWVASGGPGGTLLAHRASAGVGAGYNVFTDDAMAAAIEANLGGTLRLWLGTSAHEAQSSNNGNTIWVGGTGSANAPKLVFDLEEDTATTGSGAATLPATTASGSGTQTFTATGATTLPPATAIGTGIGGAVGTGAATLAPAAVAGTGSETLEATGSLTLPPAATDGAAAQTITGTGALTARPASVEGTGVGGAVGTGALAAQPATVAGVGSETMTAAGAVALAPALVDGAGTEAITATAAVTIQPAAVAGAGTETLTASGAVSLQVAAVAASGDHGETVEGATGDGSLTTATLAVDGAGSIALAGDAAVLLPALTVDGAGLLSLAGSGAPSGRPAAVDGAGTLTITGTGALTVVAPTMDGTGLVILSGAGVATLQPVAAAATGTEAMAGAGAITAALPTLDGTGLVAITITGSGAPTLAPSRVAGVGDETIPTWSTAAIAGPGATAVATGPGSTAAATGPGTTTTVTLATEAGATQTTITEATVR